MNQIDKKRDLRFCDAKNQIKEVDDEYFFIRELTRASSDIQYRCNDKELARMIWEYLPKIHYKKNSKGIVTWNLYQFNILVDKIVEHKDITYKTIRKEALKTDGITTIRERVNRVQKDLIENVVALSPSQLSQRANLLRKLDSYCKLYDLFLENLYTFTTESNAENVEQIVSLGIEIINKTLNQMIEGEVYGK